MAIRLCINCKVFIAGRHCKECVRKTKLAWYHRNAEKSLAYSKKYQLAHKEHCQKYKAEWRKNNPFSAQLWKIVNPEKAKMHSRNAENNRRARKKNAAGIHTILDIEKLHTKQNGQCVTCERYLKDGYHIDHIIPLSKGGSNWPSNLQLLCPRCNIGKNNTPFEIFIRRKLLEA